MYRSHATVMISDDMMSKKGTIIKKLNTTSIKRG